MSWIIHDLDEWEAVFESGGEGKAWWAQGGWRQRAPEEVAKIKAEKLRQHEESVLAEAAEIMARRSLSAQPNKAPDGKGE